MKPITLVVSAFGPYANLQTIDFRELKDKNIFLVTGPTGAGKTTIFDAISYALFGEASGSSRSKDSLRSDFASIETVTYVDLDFEIRGKIYKVKRTPQQERKKSRGEGTVQKNTEAELLMPDGQLITKATAVDEKISEILGINKNQFRQIVMLPQGEFRKLLEAESVEREAIFRKIFGTETFESIQRKLDEQKKEIYKKISEKKTTRETLARNIEPGEHELLLQLINATDMNMAEIIKSTSNFIEEDAKASELITEESKKVTQEQEKLQQKIVEGQESNKKIKNTAEFQKEYTDASLKEEEYKQKQQQLENGRKTLPIIEIENTYIKTQEHNRKKQEECKEAMNVLTEARSNLLLAKKAWQEQEGKEDDRKTLADRITTLKSREEKVTAYEQKKQKCSMLQAELQKLEQAIKDVKVRNAKEKAKLITANAKLKEAQKAEVDLEKLHVLRDKTQHAMQEVTSLYSYTQQYTAKRSKHELKSKAYEEMDRNYIAMKATYEELEDTFRRGQAGLLAKELKVGGECPVCGSTDHPKQAETVAGMPTEDELKQIKSTLESMAGKREIAFGTLSDLHGESKSQEQELLQRQAKLLAVIGEEVMALDHQAKLPHLKAKEEAMSKEVKELTEQVDALTALVKGKIKLEAEAKSSEDNIAKQEQTVADLEKEYTKNYGTVKAEEESLQIIEQEIPLDLRSISKYKAKINELEEKYKNLIDTYKTAQEHYNTMNSKNASAQASWELQEKNVTEAEKNLTEVKKELDDKIKAAGFTDYIQYSAVKMNEQQSKELDNEIQEYYQYRRSLKDRLDRAMQDTKDLQEVDLEQLVENVEQLRKSKEGIEAKSKTIFARINNNKKALEKIVKITESMKKDEEKYGIAADLAKISNGDNEERITFERYVLAAYFDEIISTSNLRLNKMTGGRYILGRKEERGKGRRQEGLELEVFDNYTGKARHVKTLSGGESFKASLALALGLADVVQSYAGGISLDTMFVDEGFGTLDPESLDHAIQCLLDLQESGRLVGIISHVPELKERIDVRIEITPEKEGSKVRFVV